MSTQSRTGQSPFVTEELLGAEDGYESSLREDEDALMMVQELTIRERKRCGGWFGYNTWEALLRGFDRWPTCDSEVRERWKSDVSAGITVGVVLVPQGMAYGILAGLDPAYGLYCGVMPLMTYALLGDSPYLALGPFALVSLLTAEAAKAACKAAKCEISSESACYISAATTLSLGVGVVQIILAASGAADMAASLLADSVMDGFTTAAACMITTSQLFHLVGFQPKTKKRALARAHRMVPVLSSSSFICDWLAVLVTSDAIKWAAVGVGVASTAALVALRRAKQRKLLHKRTPDQLLVIILATAVSAMGDCFAPCVDRLPSHLPPPQLMPWRPLYAKNRHKLATTVALLKGSVTIAIIAYLLSLAILRSLAAKAGHKDVARPTRELAAIGAANIVGAFFSSYPAAGSLSRSALAADAGASTPRHNLIACLIVAATLVALTPLFRPTPEAVLSAVVFVSLLSLFDFSAPRRLWRSGHKEDAVLWFIACAATLAAGIQQGLAISIAAAVAYLVKNVARPPVAQLGRIDGHPTLYRDLKRRKHVPQRAAVEIPGVVILRYGAAITFASRSHFAKVLTRLLPGPAESDVDEDVDQDDDHPNHPLRAVVLDCSSIHAIDSSGEKTLRELIADFKAAKIALLFACARSTLRDRLANADVLKDELIPASSIFPLLHDAVSFAEQNLVRNDSFYDNFHRRHAAGCDPTSSTTQPTRRHQVLNEGVVRSPLRFEYAHVDTRVTCAEEENSRL